MRISRPEVSGTSSASSSSAAGFSTDFLRFLVDNGYGDFDFARPGASGFGDGCDGFNGCYDLGRPLTERVDAFIGIAGANQGLSTTRGFASFLPVGNRISGLHPDSEFLEDLNADPTKEADRVYSIAGKYDQLLGRDGPNTSPIPGEDGAVRGPWGHFGARAFSTQHQLRILQKQRALPSKGVGQRDSSSVPEPQKK